MAVYLFEYLGCVNDGPDGENVAITALRQVMLRSDSNKTSLVINALVEHLSGRWRDNFSRMVACKFNKFFLLSFMEDFEAYLRVEGDGGVGEDDIENIKTKLVMLESDLEEEIEALEREGRNRRKGGYNNGNNDEACLVLKGRAGTAYCRSFSFVPPLSLSLQATLRTSCCPPTA